MVVTSAVAATVIIIAGLTIASFYTTRSISVAADDDLTIKITGPSVVVARSIRRCRSSAQLRDRK